MRSSTQEVQAHHNVDQASDKVLHDAEALTSRPDVLNQNPQLPKKCSRPFLKTCLDCQRGGKKQGIREDALL
jgi:hypothetical protein